MKFCTIEKFFFLNIYLEVTYDDAGPLRKPYKKCNFRF